jgi:microcompartment protein CcmL/EutN
LIHAIGLVEFSSIAKGIEAADIMAKTADIEIQVMKTLCPGKFMVLVSGDVSSVQQSVTAGVELAESTVVDSFVIPNVHASILPAIGGGNEVSGVKAIGVIETYSVASAIEATDVAVKAAEVQPLRLHIAFGIGGKAYCVLNGEVAAVKAAVGAGSALAAEKGFLVSSIVIPRPNKQVIDGLL